jgi:hypothetical protein
MSIVLSHDCYGTVAYSDLVVISGQGGLCQHGLPDPQLSKQPMSDSIENGPPHGRGDRRVRRRGLTRNRGWQGRSRWTRRWKKGAVHARSLIWSALPATTQLNKKGTFRPLPCDGDGLQVPGSDKGYGLLQLCIPGTLADAIRIAPCGKGADDCAVESLIVSPCVSPVLCCSA